MSDRKRFIETAKFVKRNYSSAKRILDVAGGKGDLRKELSVFRYDVKTIDPKGNDIRKCFKFDELKTLESEFGVFDLIIGLHPDGATREICKASKTHDVLILPCCNMWGSKESDIDELVQNYFRSNRINFYSNRLPIKGKNTVYYTKNHCFASRR